MNGEYSKREFDFQFSIPVWQSLLKEKINRESAHMHPTISRAQDGSESQISCLSSSPLPSEGRKVVLHRAKWITGYVPCAMAVYAEYCRSD